ncbi:MAG: glycosyltransferase family 4 protein [Anaerolineales bacterium]|nr:glycosyltransferase family 4 protein [Anaerolineales bacterium]
MGLPRICVVGQMPSPNVGGLPTQGESLAVLFAQDGYSVTQVSALSNPYLCLVDIIYTLLFRHKEFDIIVLQTFSGKAFLLSDVASLISKWMRKRLVICLRGGNLPLFSRKYSRWVYRVFQRANQIVAPSSFLAQELAWLGFPIRVIPNIIRLSVYPFRPRSQFRPRLLWMRSFHQIYNPEMAVRVLAELLYQVPEVTLTMAGPDRGLLPTVQQLAQELGVSTRITFLGFLDEYGKIKAGQEHDIYLNTNQVDNMPVSVLEMGAMGLPIVATAVGGIPYLLEDGKDALLVPPNEPETMALAIYRILTEPALAQELSRNARKKVEQFDWSAVLPQWKQLFDTIGKAGN